MKGEFFSPFSFLLVQKFVYFKKTYNGHKRKN